MAGDLLEPVRPPGLLEVTCTVCCYCNNQDYYVSHMPGLLFERTGGEGVGVTGENALITGPHTASLMDIMSDCCTQQPPCSNYFVRFSLATNENGPVHRSIAITSRH